MKSNPRPEHQISLRLSEVSQLFNSMDPTPFLHKDLDPDAEEFIETWAQEFPSDSRLQIIIHLQHPPAPGESVEMITESIQNFFSHKAELARRELDRLLSVGRTSLVIGLGFLSVCLLVANALNVLSMSPLLRLVNDSLTIGGWVAMWRPIQIFLYDWWPIVHRRRVYQNLHHAHVRIHVGP